MSVLCFLEEYSLLDLGSPVQENRNKSVNSSLLDDQLLALGMFCCMIKFIKDAQVQSYLINYLQNYLYNMNFWMNKWHKIFFFSEISLLMFNRA